MTSSKAELCGVPSRAPTGAGAALEKGPEWTPPATGIDVAKVVAPECLALATKATIRVTVPSLRLRRPRWRESPTGDIDASRPGDIIWTSC
jgi:hypothetical protein